ncbi:MAG: hypothetical protein COW55_04895 [Rhodobacteraceae bacterium CG17_big_fil_post_rev_8_21_14_2_50_65_11]|nr:MAG: hypothetical protein COW55_04895 [Rhodobacteraceae bacterium CG17_big_fil_post_rev_8_21_14_2_50_65_11]
MTSHIKIRKATGTWVVRAGGAVLGESKNALELTEGEYPPVIYFPREDIGMAFLDATDITSHCPFKGDARFYSIVTKSQVIKNAGWSYETPTEDATEIAGYLAFYPNMVAVENL